MPLLSYCIDEFLEFKRAQHLSRWTLLDYETVLRRFNREIGDFDIDCIERKTIAHYLASLDLSKKRVKPNLNTTAMFRSEDSAYSIPSMETKPIGFSTRKRIRAFSAVAQGE